MNCPECGSKDLKKFVYGYRGSCEENEVMGGCMISDTSPTHYFSACDNNFGTLSKFYEVKVNHQTISIISKTGYSKGYTIYPGAKITKTSENSNVLEIQQKQNDFTNKDGYLTNNHCIFCNTRKEIALLLTGNSAIGTEIFHKINTFNNIDIIQYLEKISDTQ